MYERLIRRTLRKIKKGCHSLRSVGRLFRKMTEIIMPNPFRSFTTKKLWCSRLKCRLERMERRMSILKQKDGQLELSSPDPCTPTQKVEMTRGIKRKLDCVDSPQKMSDSIQKRVRNAKLHAGSRRGRDRDVKSCSSTEDNKPTDKINLQKLLGACDKRIVDDGLLRTDIMYYVPPCLEVEEERATCIAKDNENNVEVPTWRLNPVSRYYNLEGTENLEDEVFLKRHQKPEIEERRRKRWDTQRLREQRMYENLKNGRRYSENKSKQDSQEQTTFSSFCPTTDEIEFIEVCDTIPVCAFGFPIPNLKPAEFELPWFDLEKREREEKIKAARKKR